jgi:hypothetical protein
MNKRIFKKEGTFWLRIGLTVFQIKAIFFVKKKKRRVLFYVPFLSYFYNNEDY